MAIQRITEFAPADRYLYDCKVCTAANGWAQFDSRQDASYFGNWVNPFRREWFSYCEGDTTLIRCETDEEFVAYVRETFAWYEERDEKRPGIDAGWPNTDGMLKLKAQFEALGLGELLH